MKVHLSNSTHRWVIVVYGSSNATKRVTLWSSLVEINRNIDGDWIVVDDFNATLFPYEKKGGQSLRDSDC